MKLFNRRFKRDNKGLSLVELLCAVAILTVISTAIGSAMAVSSDSYRRGMTETGLQQEAQFAANTVGNLIMSSNGEVSYSGSVLTITNKDAAGNVDATYVIKLEDDKLKYTLTQSGSTSEGLVASGVSSFKVNLDDFKKSHNAYVEVEMTRDNKTISANYDVSSRNDPTANAAANLTKEAIISAINEVTLEPNEYYETPVTVTAFGGASTDFSIAVSGEKSIGNTKVTKTGSGIRIELGTNETGTNGFFTITLSNPDAAVDKNIRVNVRRVTYVEVTGPDSPVSGDALKKDAVYEVSASIPDGSGAGGAGGNYNLPQVYGVIDYDSNIDGDSRKYMDPYCIYWEVRDAEMGNVLGSDKIEVLQEIQDGSPFLQFKLKEDVSSLVVHAFSKHADGTHNGVSTNKTSIKYGQAGDASKSVYGIKEYGSHNFWITDSNYLRGDEYNGLHYNKAFFDDIKDPSGATTISRFSISYRQVTVDASNNVTGGLTGWYGWYDGSTGAILNDGGSEGDSIALKRNDTIYGGMDPDKYIQVQVAVTRIRQDTKAPVYPAGGLKTPDETAGQSLDYVFKFIVPPASICSAEVYHKTGSYYDPNIVIVHNPWWTEYGAWVDVKETVSIPVNADKWTKADGVKLKKDTEYEMTWVSAAARMSKFVNANMKAHVEKQTSDGSWVPLSSESLRPFDEGTDMTICNMHNFIVRSSDAGCDLYRIRLDYDDPAYQYDHTGTSGNERGMFYFTLE